LHDFGLQVEDVKGDFVGFNPLVLEVGCEWGCSCPPHQEHPAAAGAEVPISSLKQAGLARQFLVRDPCMSEIMEYVKHGASLITPSVMEKVLRKLPLWKAEFAQINAPHYPHLVNQLEFLADAVEDFAERAYKELGHFFDTRSLLFYLLRVRQQMRCL